MGDEEEPFPGTTRARSAKALRNLERSADREDDSEFIDDWDRYPIMIVTKAGDTKECYRIGALAKAWDARTVSSIYKLERNGILPRAIYRRRSTRGTRKDRLYTREQVELVVRLAHEHGVYRRNTRKRIDKTGFAAELLKGWAGQ